MLIVKSEIQKTTGEYRVSSEFYGALDKKVAQILKDASARAKANGRKTLMAQDI